MTPLFIPKQAPEIDPITGLCKACGLARDVGHSWGCIVYFMNLSVEFYKRKVTLAQDILERLLKDNHLPTEEVELVVRQLQYASDIINNMKDKS